MTQARRILCVSSARAAHHPRHHYRLAAALREAGFDVTMMAQPDLTEGHEDAVAVEYLPVRGNRYLRMASGALTMGRALRRDADALYVLTLDLLPWAMLAHVLGRRVVVYDSNDEYDTFMLIKDWLPRRARRPLQLMIRWLEPWLAKRLDAATTALPATQSKFERAGVRSLLVRNFPPSSGVAADPPAEEPEYDILLGGSLPDEQVPLLARTARLVEERRGAPARWLVAARNYGDRDRELLEQALEEQGVRGSFDLRYNLPFPEMKRLMAASRIGFVLYPGDVNYAERIPIRIFEYMAAGLPFVASDLPTTSQFTAGHGVADLVTVGDPEAFASAIAGLLEDPARRAEMSKRGPQLVLERYNWELESQKLVNLFYELLGPNVRSSASAVDTGGVQPSSEAAREAS